MKKIILILCVSLALMSAFTLPAAVKSGIHGIVDPAEGVKKIWAISGTDSASAVAVGGNFSLEMKPGNWTVVIEAIKPYKNAILENINVQEGESTDAGLIKLKKE
jgi:uncharacterized membrane protein